MHFTDDVKIACLRSPIGSQVDIGSWGDLHACAFLTFMSFSVELMNDPRY